MTTILEDALSTVNITTFMSVADTTKETKTQNICLVAKFVKVSWQSQTKTSKYSLLPHTYLYVRNASQNTHTLYNISVCGTVLQKLNDDQR